MKKIILTFLSVYLCHMADAQTSIGLGVYPTGTEAGIGFRSSKTTKWFIEGSITKANFYSTSTLSSFLTEVSGGVRIVKLEKVFLNIGLGLRNEWNIDKNSKVGMTLPISIEAFPFSFQNAGLFFSVAPFYTSDLKGDTYSGMRTASGFIFYFPKKASQKTTTQ